MLTISRENLLKPLQMIIGVVERRQTMPILANAKISIDKNQMQITGSDLEVELIGKTELDIALKEPLSITLPGRVLLDICRSLPDQSAIDIFQEQDRVVVRSGQSRFTLATMPADEFPQVDNGNSRVEFNMEQKQLLKFLKLTYFAMAQQDVRYYLNGMLLEFQGNSLRGVSTDGHRININTETIERESDHKVQIILPRKGVIELMRLLNDDTRNINISISNNHFQATTPHFTFTSKLIEGRFPDYSSVFSTQCDKSAEMPVKELLQALQRSSIVSQGKDHTVQLQLRNNNLRILSNNSQHESAEEEVAINYDGDDIDICFNTQYLIDILQNIPYTTIRGNFTDATGHALFESTETDAHLFVIMPIRT